MELKDILALVNAGFTRNDIMNLSGRSAPSSVEPAAAAEAPTPAAAEPAPEPPKPEPAPAPVPDNSEVLAALKDLTQTIRKNAIMRDTMKPSEEPSAVDILASVINPPKK